ncbi:MAG TPA: putative Ig domain-containing protein, partial [Burkholderiaceae bacterium]|nr:putative Ig domain-containing protein [Burkholderiaceae bacterium]
AGQLRIITQIDPSLDIRTLSLGDLKLGDINVHLPAGRANFQGDFDFSASKGFVLRVSAGIDAATGVATWLLQAIDPDTGEVLHDVTRGLLARSGNPASADETRGFVGYTLRSADAPSGSEITASARLLIDQAPPIDSAPISVRLDARAPQTALAVTALGNDAQGAPTYDVQWNAVDDASGVKSVTVYVAEDGGDFTIWRKQSAPTIQQAVFTGQAGKHYEFLAVATDLAGNREAAAVANAVLPDDGARQEILDRLGFNETLKETAETPLAPADRSYPANALFAQATQQRPGRVASVQTSDLQSVLSPFTLRGFADGYRQSEADIGAQALVELPDGSVLASAGSERNQVYRYDQNGPGKQTRSTPLFTLDAPILDLAVDARGQLWAMTGAELLQIDADSGTVLQRLKGPNGDPLTHALAIAPQTGEIYVSSGNGIEIYNPAESNPGKAWRHFSKQRVGDLAFGPDGRLWGVKWTGGAVPGAALDATTDLVSFPLAGRNAGRAELEYRLAGVIDSLAFGAAGSVLDGLLIVSSNLKQRPVVDGTAETPHQAAVWMIELASRRLLQLAAGGTRGESLVATRDGRLLIAETHRIDEIAARRAANVLAVTVPDGALVPLPLNRIGVVFDQAMWLGEAIDSGSVLNPANYRLTMLNANDGAASMPSVNPQTVTWDAATNTAWLELGGQDAGLEAGRYQLEIRATLASSLEVPLNQAYVSTFTALTDLSHQLRLDFSRTRAERASGTVSYELDIVNIGSDDLKAPLMLLLDPGRYFAGSIADGTRGSGDPADLWVLDLSTALHNLGGKLAVGGTLTGQTVTLVPASRFAPRAGLADLVKAKLGHGVYAVPQNNLPPQLTVAGLADPEAASAAEATVLPPAQVGQPWSAELEAYDPDSRRVYWQLVQAPAGITLTPSADVASADDGYRHRATLNWTPSASAAADSEILVRVQDSRGGVALKRFPLAVAGGNHAPLIELATALTLHEGETLSLPIIAADADGDPLTLTVRNLPPGAVFDAGSGLLTWVPGYDQAGTYDPVTLVVSDGKTTVSQRCTITVEPGQPQPELKPVSAQTLREGERYALQLVGSVPGWRDAAQADG